MGWGGPLTVRQADAWEYWLTIIDRNEPDLHSHYLMKWMATYVNSKTKKGTPPLTADDFKSTFKLKEHIPLGEIDPNDPIQYMTKESIAEAKKQERLAVGQAERKTRKRSEVQYRGKST